MYLYKIGYHTCEESGQWEYTHEAKYSDMQLEVIVFACLLEALESKLKNNPNSPQWVEGLFDEPVFFGALGARGLTRVEYAARFSVFGWGNCLDPHDWFSHRDDIDERLCVYLRDNYRETIRRADDRG